MKIDKLKQLLKSFNENLDFEHDLKKKIGLILEENQKFSLNPNL